MTYVGDMMRTLFTLLLVYAVALPVQAASLQELEDYLNNLKTFQADFIQIDPNGGSAEGELFLKRPGHMRWNYKTPSPVVMITQGDSLLYYDKVMDELTYLPLEDIAAAMLIRAEVDLNSPDFIVKALTEEAGITRLVMQQASAPNDGDFTLSFRSFPMQLYGIELNQQGQITRMALENIRQNLPMSDEVFEFENPRGLNDPTKR